MNDVQPLVVPKPIAKPKTRLDQTKPNSDHTKTKDVEQPRSQLLQERTQTQVLRRKARSQNPSETTAKQERDALDMRLMIYSGITPYMPCKCYGT